MKRNEIINTIAVAVLASQIFFMLELELKTDNDRVSDRLTQFYKVYTCWIKRVSEVFNPIL